MTDDSSLGTHLSSPPRPPMRVALRPTPRTGLDPLRRTLARSLAERDARTRLAAVLTLRGARAG